MDESPPKRRRISPPSESSPAIASPSPSLARSRRKRPSYASPTRSSMLRNNPQIFERRQSSSPAKPVPLRSGVFPNRPGSPSRDDPFSQSLQRRDEERVPASEMNRSDQRESDDIRSNELDELSSPYPATISAGPGLSRHRGNSSVKPVPRPLPAPGPESDEDIERLLPQRSRPLVNLGVTGLVNTEPELPPSSPDPVTSTPPRGIHSSPSRWRDKRKNTFKSSPLKPRPERPSDTIAKEAGATEDARAKLDSTVHPLRNIPAFDPFSDKRKEIERLEQEIEGLNADLRITQEENNRLRLMHSSGRLLASADDKMIRGVVRRHLMPLDPNQSQSRVQIMAKAALDPVGFLAMGRAISTKLPEDYSADLEGIHSHHPAVMTAEEELSYLQLFSPFDVTSTVSILPNEPEQPQRQQHGIFVRSREASGLFQARIEMKVNADDLSILELKVSALEASAVPELQTFVDTICNGECNRSMQRNIGILCWAMAEWHCVAVERAHFWLQLEERITTKGGTVGLARKLQEKSKRRKRNEEDEDQVDESSAAPQSHPRTGILQYMGKQAMEVDVPYSEDGQNASLRFEWKIHFDWTGEAQSSLSVMIGAPGKWHSADRRGVLGKITDLFRSLVDHGESREAAVDTMIALLVSARA